MGERWIIRFGQSCQASGWSYSKEATNTTMYSVVFNQIVGAIPTHVERRLPALLRSGSGRMCLTT